MKYGQISRSIQHNGTLKIEYINPNVSEMFARIQ